MSAFIRLIIVALGLFYFQAVWAEDYCKNQPSLMKGTIELKDKITADKDKDKTAEITSQPPRSELKIVLPMKINQDDRKLIACFRETNQDWKENLSLRVIEIDVTNNKTLVVVKLSGDNFSWIKRADVRLIVTKSGKTLDDKPWNDAVDIDIVRRIHIVPVWLASMVTLVCSIAFWFLCFKFAGLRKIQGEGVNGFVLKVIVNKYGYASLSQLQIMLWTFVIGASAIYVMTLTGRLIDIEGTMLILLGGAGVVGALTALKPTGATNQDTSQTQQPTQAPPSAVIDLDVCGNPSDTVVLLWKPAMLGGSIDCYKVEYMVSGIVPPAWTTAISATTETMVTVSGLANDMTYDFQVTAINGVGTASKIIQRIGKTKYTDDSITPERIEITKPVVTSNNSITISWTHLTNNLLDNYVVRYREADTGLWLIGGIMDNKAQSFEARKLYPNTDYEFEVFAVKDGRKGQATMISAKTVCRQPLFSDLLMAIDEKEIDVSRIQMLFFTVIAAFFVVLKVFNSHELPEIPDGIITLMGISNSVYLATKFIPQK